MVYVKSILVGLGAAILSLAVLAAIAIVTSMRAVDQSSGIGAVVAVSGPSTLIVVLVTFALGFAWMFRRSR
jgi:hypothetical protein